MSKNEHTIRIHSIISRTMLQVQTGDEIRVLSRSMGVPDNGYVDFIMGLMYCSAQGTFRNESKLDEPTADRIFLAFWQKEGTGIRNRLLQLIEERK